MRQADLAKKQSTGKFATFSEKLRKQLQIFPNRMYYNADERIAVLGVRQSRNGADYALSVAGLRFIMSAQYTGRFNQGYVALEDENGKFLTWDTVPKICRKVKGISVREGTFGSFWWLNELMEPLDAAINPGTADQSRVREYNEIPF